MISRWGGTDSRYLAISAAGRAACRPRMMGSGGMRMAAGILWLTAGYTRELVTSSAIASPASSFVLAEATSMRGAIIIGAARVALRVAARVAARTSGAPGWRTARRRAG